MMYNTGNTYESYTQKDLISNIMKASNIINKSARYGAANNLIVSSKVYYELLKINNPQEYRRLKLNRILRNE